MCNDWHNNFIFFSLDDSVMNGITTSMCIVFSCLTVEKRKGYLKAQPNMYLFIRYDRCGR